MRLAIPAVEGAHVRGLEWRLVYGLLLPLFVISEGFTRLYDRATAEPDEPVPSKTSWSAEARSQTSIATSYALMAKSMLQSSERRTRPERLSRLDTSLNEFRRVGRAR
jgi:hypothetical protein